MKMAKGRPRVINKLRLLGDEVIPMERHGEMGHVFSPKTQLTMDDLTLYAHVHEAWGDRDLQTRDNVVALVEQVAKKEIKNAQRRKKMIQTVMAYIDEIQNMQLRTTPAEGSA